MQTLSGIGSPMSEQPVLKVFRAKRGSEQRIVAEINHSCTQVVAGPPIGVHLPQFFRA